MADSSIMEDPNDEHSDDYDSESDEDASSKFSMLEGDSNEDSWFNT